MRRRQAVLAATVLLSFLALSVGCSRAPEPGGLKEASNAPELAAGGIDEPSSAGDGSPAYWRNHSWMFEIEDNRGHLRFAVPETDDEPITFACERRSGRAQVTAVDPQHTGATLVLASQGEKARHRSQPISNPDIDSGVYSRAEVSTSESVLQSFKETMELAFGEPPLVVPVRTEADRSAIATFFAYCDA